ncbi:hypothetical protein Tsubulata_006707 [Turnera subulata]|uniref:Fungal lipase-like domain-containing protein n=1 Tax=Turnera subulata TaxID=218843 RepID=A0A9Q0JSF1_9ROSI|nr:hypothetical protein Tsubulata_006707 [Turnera subulata]
MGSTRPVDGAEMAKEVIIKEELIKKTCSLAMKDQKEPYLCNKSSLYPQPIFGDNNKSRVFCFSSSCSVDDWWSNRPFGETKVDSELFPSLKCIGLEEIATVNQAFQERFKAILSNPNFKNEVGEAVRSKKQVIFTGHSSGGAVAILATIWFLEEYRRKEHLDVKPYCVTYGSPLVGDRIINHSLRREDWSCFFINVVNRYDIVPRVLLAPFSSTDKHLQQVSNFFNQKSQSKRVLPENASDFYKSVIRNASSVASHAACKLMGSTNALLETVSSFVGLSPYRPIGTYVFCTGDRRPVMISNSDAILQTLFYSCQLSVAGDLQEIARKSFNDHLKYKQDILGSLQWESAIVLDHQRLGAIPLSSGTPYVESTTNEALDNLGLSEKARLCLRAAAEFEKQKYSNKTKINEKTGEIKSGIKELEGYKKNCEASGVCFYDAFRASDNEADFHANVTRLNLAGIWDEIVELLKRSELPDEFEVLGDWVELGTSYRRITEPLDIANYYRHLKNEDTGPYMAKGRPKRYKCTERWRDHDLRRPSELTGSCFWAQVEELHGRTGSPGSREEITSLNEKLATWIQEKELGEDVRFKNSSFMKLLES